MKQKPPLVQIMELLLTWKCIAGFLEYYADRPILLFYMDWHIEDLKIYYH